MKCSCLSVSDPYPVLVEVILSSSENYPKVYYDAPDSSRGPSHFFRLRLRSFPKFWNPVRIRIFFKFENPTPVQTPATIIDPPLIYPCFYIRNDHTDSCYCRNWKVTPGPVFPNFLTPGPKEKRRILPESTPGLVPPLSDRLHFCIVSILPYEAIYLLRHNNCWSDFTFSCSRLAKVAKRQVWIACPA